MCIYSNKIFKVTVRKYLYKYSLLHILLCHNITDNRFLRFTIFSPGFFLCYIVSSHKIRLHDNRVGFSGYRGTFWYTAIRHIKFSHTKTKNSGTANRLHRRFISDLIFFIVFSLSSISSSH